MMHFITNRLRSAHDEEGGQTMIFIAIVLFALVCFFALVVNVGHRVTSKVEMQNAADAAAMSGGIWNARGLNTISVLNVGMTECLAFIIMFKAFDKTYIATKIALEANIAVAEACSKVPYIQVVCIPWLACLKVIKAVSLKVAEQMNKLMKKLTKKDKGLWQVMKWLEHAETGVRYSFPLIAAFEANKIAELNHADAYLRIDIEGVGWHVLFFPTDPLGLPVKKGEFKDLCKPTTEGGSGYTNFLCWDSALGMEVPIPGLEGTPLDGITKVRTLFAILWELAFICVLPPPGLVWEGMVELSEAELCGGADGKHQPTETTTKCSVCDQKNGDPTWSGQRRTIDCDRYRQIPRVIRSLGAWEDAADIPEGQRYPCSNPIKNDTGSDPCYVTCYEAPSNGPCYEYKWILKGCTYKGDEEDVQQEDTSNEAKPLMLETDWEDKTKYTAIVHQKTRDKLAFGRYREGGETFSAETILADATWAFAQVEIYNPTDADLFNQDWHVKLKPCKINDLRVSFFDQDIASIIPGKVKEVIDKGLGEAMVH